MVLAYVIQHTCMYKFLVGIFVIGRKIPPRFIYSQIGGGGEGERGKVI